jgi:hypothetical protein
MKKFALLCVLVTGTVTLAGPVEDAAKACSDARAKADLAYSPGAPLLNCDGNYANAVRLKTDAQNAISANQYKLQQSGKLAKCNQLMTEGNSELVAGANNHQNGAIQYGQAVLRQSDAAMWASQGNENDAIYAYQDATGLFNSAGANFNYANSHYRTAAEVKYQGVLNIVYP